MATSANSIIKLYQNASTANTAATSIHNVCSTAPSVHDKSEQLYTLRQDATSPTKTIDSLTAFPKIENLPSPYNSDSPPTQMSNDGISGLTAAGGQHTSLSKNSITNSANSFFSIPLKLLNVRKKRPKGNLAELVGTSAELESTPLDIISESPVGELVTRDAIDQMIKEEEMKSAAARGSSLLEQAAEERVDPIYETYIRYVYHTEAGDTFLTDGEEEIKFSDTATIVDDSEGTETGGGNDVESNPNKILNASNVSENLTLPRISTISRLKTKTKLILKQISARYETELKNFNDNSLKPTKNELKRRLSGYSMRQSASIKKIRENIGTARSHRGEQSTKAKSLLSLFDSSDFNQRLSEGSVSARKEVNYFSNENEDDEDDDADNYHIFYKLNPHVDENFFGTENNPADFRNRRMFKRSSIKRHLNNVDVNAAVW